MTVKRLARNYPVPQTRDEADRMIFDLGALRREILRLETAMNDALAKVKEHYEAEAQPLKDKAEEMFSGIETWCDANREQLTRGGQVKFAVMKSGEVKWRTRPPKVVIRAADVVIEALKSLGLTRFVRIKEEINKDAILSEPDAVRAVKGISIGSEGEDFVVEPFEQELAKV
jgi:phage host-nuclease inhibitor protein Gam